VPVFDFGKLCWSLGDWVAVFKCGDDIGFHNIGVYWLLGNTIGFCYDFIGKLFSFRPSQGFLA